MQLTHPLRVALTLRLTLNPTLGMPVTHSYSHSHYYALLSKRGLARTRKRKSPKSHSPKTGCQPELTKNELERKIWTFSKKLRSAETTLSLLIEEQQTGTQHFLTGSSKLNRAPLQPHPQIILRTGISRHLGCNKENHA